jgi:hypothetical protein
MLTCEQIKNMMSSYIDGELSSAELIDFEKHINDCKACKDELKLFESIIDTCGSFDEVELPADFKQNLHQKLVQTQHDMKKNTPPWYLNWRMYSGLAVGILLIFVMKSQVFDSIYKSEKAYINDAKLEYNAEVAKKDSQPELKEEKSLKINSSAEEEQKDLINALQSNQGKNVTAFSDFNVGIQAQEISPNSKSAAAVQSTLIPEQLQTEGRNQLKVENRTEMKSENSNLHDQKEQVSRSIYGERKPLIVYKVIVKIKQEDTTLLMEKLQEQFNQYEGQYAILDNKLVIVMSKEQYSEMLEYVKTTGIELKIDQAESNETNKYQNLIQQYDNISKKIDGLQEELKLTTKQEEIDAINKQIQGMLKQQQNLQKHISILEQAIGKSLIEIEIVS